MLGKIFKTIGFAVVTGAVGLGLAGRWKLDAMARARVATALAAAPGLAHGHVHGRLFPPAAVIDDLEIRGDGSRVLSANRLELPLVDVPFLAQPPRLVSWTLALRVPRAGPVPVRTLFAGAGLPAWRDWDAVDGRVELRAGEPPASATLVLSGVRVSRRDDHLTIDGAIDVGGSGRVHADGRIRDGAFAGTAALGPLDAKESASLLVDPHEATIRGGTISLEGSLSASARAVAFAGDIATADVVVEGRGAPSAFERRLRSLGPGAKIPLALTLDLSRGLDGPRAFRAAIADAGAAP